MAETIVGLDIGTGSVKAVLLSRGLRGGHRILAARLFELASAEDLPAALEKLFAEPAFRGSLCVTSLPARLLSFRNLALPFREERKIRQALAFALEPQLHVPPAEVFVDYVVTDRARQAEILAAVAPREIVEQRTSLLAGLTRETAVIDVEAVPLAARLCQEGREALCLLDVGAEDSTAVFANRGRIVHVRHFPFGGRIATVALAEALGIGLSEAEGLKIRGGLPPEAERALAECSRPFLHELKNTHSALLWQGILSAPAARVIVTGGGSRTWGLRQSLAATFSVPVEETDLAATAQIALEEGVARQWDPARLDGALALAARPLRKAGGFDFRLRALESRSGYGRLRHLLKQGAAAALAMAVLGAGETALGDYGQRLRLAALKKEINAEVKRIAPEITRIVDPVSQLKAKIAEAKKAAAGTAEGLAPVTVLDLLKEISSLAPPELLLTSFNLDGEAISLKGEVPSFEALEAAKKELANSRLFKTVTVGSSSLVKQGGAVEFDMKVIVRR